jgi:hypothetical protein
MMNLEKIFADYMLLKYNSNVRLKTLKMQFDPIAITDLRKSIPIIADKMEAGGTAFQVFRRSTPSFKIVPNDAVIQEDWETVVDFTIENKEGITLDKALKYLN